MYHTFWVQIVAHTAFYIMCVTSETAVLQCTIAGLFWNMSLFCLPMKILWQCVLCQPNSSNTAQLGLKTKLFTNRWVLLWFIPLTWNYHCLFWGFPDHLCFWSSLQGNSFIKLIVSLSFQSASFIDIGYDWLTTFPTVSVEPNTVHFTSKYFKRSHSLYKA